MQREFRDDGSEIYVANYYSPPSASPTQQTYTNSKPKTHVGVSLETMSAPNPFCPHAKNVCCLLLLINLGLILLTLGFSIVLQIFEPKYIWYLGLVFIATAFVALVTSLIYCVSICRKNDSEKELYWTTHFRKNIQI